jgi:hypothetical protein
MTEEILREEKRRVAFSIDLALPPTQNGACELDETNRFRSIPFIGWRHVTCRF